MIYTKSERKNIILWCLLLNKEVEDRERIKNIINKMKYPRELKEKIKGGIIKHMTEEYLKEIGTTWQDKVNLDIWAAEDEGIEKGRQEGIKVGYDNGKRSNSIFIATKLIEKNMDFKDIAEITNLPIEKIKDLSCNIKIKSLKHQNLKN